MQGNTHAAVGMAAALAAGSMYPGVAAALVGSYLPDADTPHSMIGTVAIIGLMTFLPASVRPALKAGKVEAVLVVGAYLALAFLGRHRGFTHSFAGLGTAALAFGLILGFGAVWPFALGYFLHLVLDALTPAGIALYWPSPQRFGIHLLWSGGFIDRWIGGLALLAAGMMIMTREGIWRLIALMTHDLMKR